MSLVNVSFSSISLYNNNFVIEPTVYPLQFYSCPQKVPPLRLERFKNIEKIFEQVRLGNERDFQDDLYKTEGYCKRWFKEPLEEWVEERTPLGRLVGYYHDYMEYPSNALLKRMLLLFPKAEEEAKKVVKKLQCWRQEIDLPEEHKIGIGPFVPAENSTPCWRLERKLSYEPIISLEGLRDSHPWLIQFARVYYSEELQERMAQIWLKRAYFPSRNEQGHFADHQILEVQRRWYGKRIEEIVFEQRGDNVDLLFRKLREYYQKENFDSLFKYNARDPRIDFNDPVFQTRAEKGTLVRVEGELEKRLRGNNYWRLDPSLSFEIVKKYFLDYETFIKFAGMRNDSPWLFEAKSAKVLFSSNLKMRVEQLRLKRAYYPAAEEKGFNKQELPFTEGECPFGYYHIIEEKSTTDGERSEELTLKYFTPLEDCPQSKNVAVSVDTLLNLLFDFYKNKTINSIFR